VDVTLTPDELLHVSLAGKTAVVIDVLRATTSIVTALENGAAGVLPVAEVDETRRLAAHWPQGAPPLPPGAEGAADREPLLAGERGARPPAGFHLGNSPLDFGEGTVRGRAVVLTTTNGTRALERAAEAAEVRVACLRNAAAAAAAVLDAGRDVVIACAGTEGRMSLEDVACAAVLLEELASAPGVRWGDGARLVRGWMAAAGMPAGDEGWAELLGDTVHGRRLLELGFERDVAFCARLNASGVVPLSRGGWLVAP